MALYFRNITFLNFQHVCKLNCKRSVFNLPKRNFNDKIMGFIWKYNNFQGLHLSCLNYKRRKTAEEKKVPRIIEYSKSKSEVISVWEGITLVELADILKRDINYVEDLFLNDVPQRNTPIYDMKYLQNAMRRGGKRIKYIAKPTNDSDKDEDIDLHPRPAPSKELLKPRPPVVTVMGHVDHGKTTLLDALRHSSIVEKEFGGITQHIGAFLVNLQSGRKITFLDTPGHAAFSSMRARGANVTDIVILVVAADDGVMEQTIESVKMARTANVPILVAINKIDAPKADIEHTGKMLLEVGIQIEKLGGDVQAVPISALKRQNLEQLTEALILQADLLNVAGDPTGPVEAVVIESNVHQFRGKITTLVIQRGTLKKGDILVAGTAMAKVKSIKNADGTSLNEVPPGYPAEIDGWKDLPSAGDIVLETKNEKFARRVIKFREDQLEKKKMAEDLQIIKEKREEHEKEYKENLNKKRLLGRFRSRREGPRKPETIEKDGLPSINVIIKADVDGTLEAILETLDTYEEQDCPLDIVHYGVGPVTQADIDLAKTFNCVIYTFNVEVSNSAKSLVKQEEEIDIRQHNVIYKLIDDFREEVNKRLPQKEIEEILGEAEVLQQFEVGKGRKLVPVAGCRCLKGNLKRDALYRVIRNREIIHEGPLSSMRHLKSEVDVIKEDTECGLQLADSSISFEKGDQIQCFERKMVNQQTLWNPGF
ncbi:hypothetical protein ABEB36_002584 [Hypothenemus hampei]|uniref:Tr-type G domain-containing protein n=1 Tax=Hypothenemus hampei TaxID=57062 RepID=A0ABD1F807_HYPHA